MKNKYMLKNWSFYGYLFYLIAQGNVYGNPKFEDGTFIHTSNVVNIIDCGDHKEIETLNSIYCVYPDDVAKDFLADYLKAFDSNPYEELGKYNDSEGE